MSNNNIDGCLSKLHNLILAVFKYCKNHPKRWMSVAVLCLCFAAVPSVAGVIHRSGLFIHPLADMCV